MTTLPPPPNWRDRDVIIVFGIALFGASAVAAAFVTVLKLERSDYLTAAITFGGSVIALSYCLIGVRGRFMTRPLRARSSASGTEFFPDPILVWLTGIAFATAIPTGLLYVIFVPRGEVDLPLSRGDQIFSPILIGGLVVFSTVGLVAMARRRGTGHLRFTRDGFELVSLLFTQIGSWDDVTDVTDEAQDKQIRHPIALVLTKGRPVVIRNASGFVPNGAALYWMVRHYWKHPENRVEFTDGRALQRLRTEDFEPE